MGGRLRRMWSRHAGPGALELLVGPDRYDHHLARTSGGWAAGMAVSVLLAVLLPHPDLDGLRTGPIVVACLAGLMASVVVLKRAQWFPAATMIRINLLGCAAIAALIYAAGPSVEVSTVAVIAATTGAFVIYSIGPALLSLAIMAVGYAIVLASTPDHPAPFNRWVAVVGMAVTTGATIRWVIRRVQVLADEERAARADAERARADLEQANRALEDANLALAVASRHKSEFLANMSHELRTPLNAVIGFSDVLALRLTGDLNEQQAQYVDDIRSSGEHLLALINDVLDLAKVEAGVIEIEPHEFSLADLLTSCTTAFRERIAARAVTLTVDVDASVRALHGDERRIRQVVLNLLSNAVKFTPPGGRVGVSATVDDGDVVIAVADTGTGISAEDLLHIFDDFRQGAAARTTDEPGTGLGLALVKRLVELHGGSVEVESETGRGSTFTVRLPLPTVSVA